MFKIEFEDGKFVTLDAFNASQAVVLAGADRIRSGEVKHGYEYKVKSITKLRPSKDVEETQTTQEP